MSEVKRYDCTNGKAQHCYGCYQMTESAEGDYVSSADFDAQRLRADTAEAELAECKRDRDTEQRAAIEANANLKVANRRIVDLTKAFEKFRDIVRGAERLASQYSPCIDAVDEGGGDDNDDPTLAIFHRLYYAMFDADAALNPNPEAESHE